MKQVFVILTLLSFIFFYSCRKDKNPLFDGINCTGNCYILTGKLLDSAANVGLANADIKFYYRDLTGTFSNKRHYLGKVVTDQNGNYNFTFDGTRFNNILGYYYAEAFKGKMFYAPTDANRVATFDLDTSNYNIPFVQNFPLFRPASLKLRIIASTITNFEFLTITYNYGPSGYGIALNGRRQIDTTIIYKTAGDIRTFIQSVANGNGINITKKDTVIVPANSIKQVEIRF